MPRLVVSVRLRNRSFDEGICLPPVKIIEGFEIRRDIEEVYLRSSRKPEMVALDFRAQMVGNSSARQRLLDLIQTLRLGYGQGRDEKRSSLTARPAILKRWHVCPMACGRTELTWSVAALAIVRPTE